MGKFADKNVLRSNVYWSAFFESWNQRTDELYYKIVLYKKKGTNYKETDSFTFTTINGGDIVKEDDALFDKIERFVLGRA